MKKEMLELQNAETISENIDARKGALYGYDLDNTQWRRLAVDATGQVKIDPTNLDALYLKLNQVAPQTITGTGPIFNNLTINRVVFTDASKKLVTIDWMDQSVKTTASPTFSYLTVSNNFNFLAGGGLKTVTVANAVSGAGDQLKLSAGSAALLSSNDGGALTVFGGDAGVLGGNGGDVYMYGGAAPSGTVGNTYIGNLAGVQKGNLYLGIGSGLAKLTSGLLSTVTEADYLNSSLLGLNNTWTGTNYISTVSATAFKVGSSPTLQVDTTTQLFGQVGVGIAPTDQRFHIGYGHMQFDQMANPTTAPSGSVSSGGSVEDGYHHYAYSWVTATGETKLSLASGQIIADASNKTVNLTGVLTGPTGTTSRKIYRTKANKDPGSNFWYFVKTINNNTDTTVSDNVSDTTLTLTKWRGDSENSTAGIIFINTLKAMTLGDSNTAFGVNTFLQLAGGFGNVGFGQSAMRRVTDGYQNACFGANAGYNITTGTVNTLVGFQAGYGLVTASATTAVGRTALTLATGGYNTALGFDAGAAITTGTYNTFLGTQCGTTGTTNNIQFSIGIGWNVQLTTSNTLALGTGTQSAPYYAASSYGISNIQINGKTDTDLAVNFNCTTHSGLFTWMEDEDYFKFDDDIFLPSTGQLFFSDTSSYIQDDGTNLLIVTNDDLKLTCGANKTLELQNVVYEDLRVAVNDTKEYGASSPTWDVFKDNGAGSTGTYIPWFVKDAEKELFFAVQIPHSWSGGDMTPHIHWVPKTNGALNATVEWGFEYTWSAVGGTFGNTTIVYTKTSTSGDTTLVAGKHYISNFSTISLATPGTSSMLVCRVFRNGADVTDDTYDDYAGMLEFDFHFPVNTMGSRQIATK